MSAWIFVRFALLAATAGGMASELYYDLRQGNRVSAAITGAILLVAMLFVIRSMREIRAAVRKLAAEVESWDKHSYEMEKLMHNTLDLLEQRPLTSSDLETLRGVLRVSLGRPGPKVKSRV